MENWLSILAIVACFAFVGLISVLFGKIKIPDFENPPTAWGEALASIGTLGLICLILYPLWYYTRDKVAPEPCQGCEEAQKNIENQQIFADSIAKVPFKEALMSITSRKGGVPLIGTTLEQFGVKRAEILKVAKGEPDRQIFVFLVQETANGNTVRSQIWHGTYPELTQVRFPKNAKYEITLEVREGERFSYRNKKLIIIRPKPTSSRYKPGGGFALT